MSLKLQHPVEVRFNPQSHAYQAYHHELLFPDQASRHIRPTFPNPSAILDIPAHIVKRGQTRGPTQEDRTSGFME